VYIGLEEVFAVANLQLLPYLTNYACRVSSRTACGYLSWAKELVNIFLRNDDE